MDFGAELRVTAGATCKHSPSFSIRIHGFWCRIQSNCWRNVQTVHTAKTAFFLDSLILRKETVMNAAVWNFSLTVDAHSSSFLLSVWLYLQTVFFIFRFPLLSPPPLPQQGKNADGPGPFSKRFRTLSAFSTFGTLFFFELFFSEFSEFWPFYGILWGFLQIWAPDPQKKVLPFLPFLHHFGSFFRRGVDLDLRLQFFWGF
jgi:hypothetical protein